MKSRQADVSLNGIVPSLPSRICSHKQLSKLNPAVTTLENIAQAQK
ncbi:hypothetical protein NYE33_09295 [Paenibacillus sp. FSL R10-2199]